MPCYYYAAQTAKNLQTLAADGTAVAVIPIGAVEQHGPHLPVGTDYLAAEDITAMAVEKVKTDVPVLVLPTISYALSIEHIHIPGTLTLMPQTLINVLTDIGDGLIRLGVQKLVFVNGHGGNDSAIQIAGRLLNGKGLKVYMVNGRAIRDALGAKEYHIHADMIETSVMMATHPEMVIKEEMIRRLSDSIDKWHQSADYRGDLISCWYIEDIAVDGVVGDPILASGEFGESFMEGQSDRIARAIELAADL